MALLAALAARPSRGEAANAIDAVFFVAPQSSSLDPARVREAGIRVVTSAVALQAAAPAARVVMLDRAVVPLVSGDWLAGQCAQGKRIVGIDIPIIELPQLADFHPGSGLGNFLQEYGGRPFYSWFYQRTERSGVGRGGAGSDIIYSTDDFLGRLRSQGVGSQADYTPTRSPAEPPPPQRPSR